MLPEKIGPYILQQELGAGSEGTVYRALHEPLNREVALKVLSGRDQLYADTRARFLREIAISANLNHPGLVRLYDADTAESAAYLAMELVDGPPLSTLFHAGTPVSWKLGAAIGARVAAGLAHLHAHSILHRDIKPSNILLSASGQVKLSDFGIARAFDSATLTRSGELVGTLPYVAPELLIGAEESAGSDLWALGCVLYQLLTTRHPFFTEGSDISLASAILNRLVNPPALVNPAVPGPVSAVVMELLERDPARRLSSAHLVEQRLSGFLDRYALQSVEEVLEAELVGSPDALQLHGVPTVVLTVTTQRTVRKAASRRTAAPPRRTVIRRWMTLVALLATCLAFVMGIAGPRFFRHSDQVEPPSPAAAVTGQVRQFLQSVTWAAEPVWVPAERNPEFVLDTWKLMNQTQRRLEETPPVKNSSPNDRLRLTVLRFLVELQKGALQASSGPILSLHGIAASSRDALARQLMPEFEKVLERWREVFRSGSSKRLNSQDLVDMVLMGYLLPWSLPEGGWSPFAEALGDLCRSARPNDAASVLLALFGCGIAGHNTADQIQEGLAALHRRLPEWAEEDPVEDACLDLVLNHARMAFHRLKWSHAGRLAENMETGVCTHPAASERALDSVRKRRSDEGTERRALTAAILARCVTGYCMHYTVQLVIRRARAEVDPAGGLTLFNHLTRPVPCSPKDAEFVRRLAHFLSRPVPARLSPVDEARLLMDFSALSQALNAPIELSREMAMPSPKFRDLDQRIIAVLARDDGPRRQLAAHLRILWALAAGRLNSVESGGISRIYSHMVNLSLLCGSDPIVDGFLRELAARLLVYLGKRAYGMTGAPRAGVLELVSALDLDLSRIHQAFYSFGDLRARLHLIRWTLMEKRDRRFRPRSFTPIQDELLELLNNRAKPEADDAPPPLELLEDMVKFSLYWSQDARRYDATHTAKFLRELRHLPGPRGRALGQLAGELWAATDRAVLIRNISAWPPDPDPYMMTLRKNLLVGVSER